MLPWIDGDHRWENGLSCPSGGESGARPALLDSVINIAHHSAHQIHAGQQSASSFAQPFIGASKHDGHNVRQATTYGQLCEWRRLVRSGQRYPRSVGVCRARPTVQLPFLPSRQARPNEAEPPTRSRAADIHADRFVLAGFDDLPLVQGVASEARHPDSIVAWANTAA